MNTYVALLRGINVGGNNILPMQKFREVLAGIGCEDVATYIQSGNAVLRHTGTAKKLAAKISTTIEAQFGFRPQVMVLKSNDFLKIAAENPYVAEAVEPKHLHVSFLLNTVQQTNTAYLDEIAANDEKFTLTQAAFYLHAPNGIGRSKLAANVEKSLGVKSTGRNWRTVGKISDMLSKLVSPSD